jgi:hypothetical protein
MRLLFFFFCVFAFSYLQAQDNAAVAVAADGPALVYRAETKTEACNFKLNRKGRERTLLGDLDLSGAWGGPTYNYSSTGDDWALMRGGFGGLEFSEEFFLGYGGWKNREDFTTNEVSAISPEFDFKHSGLIIAYTPFSDNAIHPRISAIFGPGKMEITDNFNNEGVGQSDRFLVGQATVGLELNLFQWFRLGVDGGYRFASGVENEFVTANDIGGAIVQVEARFGFSW